MSSATEKMGSVQVSRKSFVELMVSHKSGGARVIVDLPVDGEKPGGRLFIAGDYGSWSYYWGNIGDRTLFAFLAGCDRHYIGNKLLGSGFLVFDLESTVEELRKEVLRSRREYEIDREEARNEWGLIDSLESGDLSFDQFYGETFIDDAYQYHQDKENPQWVAFWDRLWVPLIVPELRKLDQEYSK